MNYLPHILQSLTTLLQQQCTSLDLTHELTLAEQALTSGVEAQLLRALKLLVIAVNAAGPLKVPVIHESPVFLEAMQIVCMTGRAIFSPESASGF